MFEPQSYNTAGHSDAGPLEDVNAIGTIVVKIGGSTLGSNDTTLRDLAEFQKRGVNAVVVHGGGKIISDWMKKQGVSPRFENGLRVTDEQSLDIAVAVLTGLINKQIVASLLALGARAIGISGADGGMLRGRVKNESLGLVGEISGVNPDPIKTVLSSGCIPVIAPVAVRCNDDKVADGSLLNVNADTAAGQIAAALDASRLVFLTDVEGVLDPNRRLIPRLTARQARELMESRVAGGGMIPKLEACLAALESGSVSQIIDGRVPGALANAVENASFGTRIG